MSWRAAIWTFSAVMPMSRMDSVGTNPIRPGIAAMRSGVVMMGCMVAPLGLRVRFATGGLWLETANTNEASDNCFRGARPVTACGEMNFAPWWRGWKPWARKCKANRGQGCSPCGVAASDQVTAQPAVSLPH